ncbi:DDE_superfamily endonuclease domain-containing protein [Hexamita inflata]|uniref:DDE superfamily endonuclease domain-containing protein n=1 Tax=Hexamita inflata TaxID=28002 RepID=A0AA86R1E4_9EUKA|nr:DDE superfamily endonuclease domain-containing protein [Hexamita inflata]
MSLTTVSRLLAKFSLSFYVAKIKPKLIEKHKLESLNFARMNLKQPIEYWRTFLYTDECCSKCYANRADRVLRAPRTSGIRSIFSKCKIWTVFVHDLQYDQLQIQGSIMVYAVRYDHEFNCQFLSSQTSYTSITQQHNLKLQQDNAPTHFSKYMKNFYTANNIELYRFPVMSPDLNPLFHCWNPLKSNISPEECTTYDLLNEEVKRALEQISLDIINHLIDSMPKRLEEVIKQKGDATKH